MNELKNFVKIELTISKSGGVIMCDTKLLMCSKILTPKFKNDLWEDYTIDIDELLPKKQAGEKK